MRAVRHVIWRHNGVGGRVAVFYNGYNYLVVTPIGGKRPPAELTFAILDVALSKDWRKQAEQDFRSNIRPWRVDTRRGMSGCWDFCTRRLVDETLAIVKTTAMAHITASGYIYQIEGRIGEVAPILACLQEKFPQAEVHRTSEGWEGELEGSSFMIRKVEPHTEGFQSIDDTPSLGLWKPEDSDFESSSSTENHLPEIEIV